MGFFKRAAETVNSQYDVATTLAVALDPANRRVAKLEARGTPANCVITGIRFTVPDAEAEHAAMRERGVNVGELLRWDGVPPMFSFDDLDGNRFYVVEEPR